MSPAALLAMILLAGAAGPIDVRVKSRHEKASAEGGRPECYKVGAQAALRSAAIGPGSVRVSLRRLAAIGAPPIEIRLTRDGREMARLSLPAGDVQKFTGESERASSALQQIIELPEGPHTLFVEVGPGEGHVLVSFNEPLNGLVAVAPQKTGTIPPVEVMPKAETTQASQALSGSPLSAAKPGTKAPAAKPVENAAGDQKPAADLLPKKPVDREPLAPKLAVTPPAPDKPPAKAAELAHAPTSPVAPEKPSTASLETRAPLVAASLPAGGGVRAVAALPSAHRLFAGVRAGGASQVQLAAMGLAVGLSARYLAWGQAGPAGVRGLLVGLSADVLRYSLALEVGSTRAVAANTAQIELTNLPVLVEAIWSLGDPGRRRLTPVFGVTGGISLCSVSTKGTPAPIHEIQARPAFGAVAGVELPLRAGRLGAEVRYVYSTTDSKGSVQNFQIGGILAQASWRFGF